MQQFFPSSQNLQGRNQLSTGSFELSAALAQAKQSNYPQIHLNAPLPSEPILLHWAEVSNPFNLAKVDFASELISPKLLGYKFHYVGNFALGERVISSASQETFIANLGERPVHQHSFESESRANCSWLLDLLSNAAKYSEQPNPDQLSWQQVEAGFALVLSRQTDRYTEQEEFVFDRGFQTLSWTHRVLFR